MPNSPQNPDIDAACNAAASAFRALSTLPPESRAQILDAIAAALDAQRDHILHTCAAETALTIEELTPEFARTTGTLRMFAALVRDGSWCRAAIDARATEDGFASSVPAAPPVPEHRGRKAVLGGTPPIGPNHDLRSLLLPLGPIAVFGSSNFPLAYGVCGGDTASALAAGCPVIVKEHPAHPRTGRLLAEIAQHAIHTTATEITRLAHDAGHAEITELKERDAEFYDGGAEDRLDTRTKERASLSHLLSYIHNEDSSDFTVAERLVKSPWIDAVGFTGSTSGGTALQRHASERRAGPLPVFAEMGSLNCVFIRSHAFAKRGPQIADELAASVLARVGQQCTKPGVVFIEENNEHWALHRMMCDRLLAAPPRRMLSRSVADNYYRRLDAVSASRGVLESTPLPTPDQRAAMLGLPVVIAAADTAMEDEPEVWEEIFGPAIIVARTFGSALWFMPGALTVSVYAEPEDIDPSLVRHYDQLNDEFQCFLDRVVCRGGRITFNGPPTGVRVATSMVHGGPFPATNRPDTTAVGPRAIERWCRPICFQNCPDALLPAELQNANPRALWRTVNGEFNRSPIQ